MSDFFKDLGSRLSPLIIAEIGAKYGDIDTVERMVKSAVESGADMVKFQTYKAETIATPGSFFTFEDGSKVSQFEFFKQHELTDKDHDRLSRLCMDLGIRWTSTPSHTSDLELLERYDLSCYKTGSDDLTNLRFLSQIAEKKRPMIVSTGMCSLSEIEAAIAAITEQGNENIILLHCVVSYPSKAEDANLRMIETLKKAFGFPVGLSDHTTDELTSVIAASLGAIIIEKHFTLDHSLHLPDHQASLDPFEFATMVRKVRLVNKALGSGIKVISETEKKWRNAARKSLVASRDIQQGDVITDADIEIRRPATGLHPHRLKDVVGMKAKEKIEANSLIKMENLVG